MAYINYKSQKKITCGVPQGFYIRSSVVFVHEGLSQCLK